MGSFALGVAVTVLATWYSIREPVVAVSCLPQEASEPAALTCRIVNEGRGAAHDVVVAFNQALPVDTVLEAPIESAARLEPVAKPPNPVRDPSLAVLETAFIVRVPVVPAKDTLEFVVRTHDPDNVRAAKQVRYIRNEIIDVMHKFHTRVLERHPNAAQNWQIDAVVSARVKQENFFHPHRYSYEGGRANVYFLSETEQRAVAVQQDRYGAFKADVIDVFRGRPKLKAPVIRLLIAEGQTTMGVFPPYISTYTELRIPVDELIGQSQVGMSPPIPETYDFEDVP